MRQTGRSKKLRFEHLENREMLNGDVAVSMLFGRHLFINDWKNTSNQIAVFQTDAPVTTALGETVPAGAVVVLGGDPTSLNGSQGFGVADKPTKVNGRPYVWFPAFHGGIQSLWVSLNGGNDVLALGHLGNIQSDVFSPDTVDLAAASVDQDFAATETGLLVHDDVNVNLGKGDDALIGYNLTVNDDLYVNTWFAGRQGKHFDHDEAVVFLESIVRDDAWISTYNGRDAVILGAGVDPEGTGLLGNNPLGVFAPQIRPGLNVGDRLDIRVYDGSDDVWVVGTTARYLDVDLGRGDDRCSLESASAWKQLDIRGSLFERAPYVDQYFAQTVNTPKQKLWHVTVV